ncbi:exodeoxyribonuclease VII large subunit [Halocatena salina]|uniref:Exodeoxyribonuclease VII large subunit n=1 Tax=Halocatena salina TaxID=2934340 RepID=A0A8U0A8H7_9EURY|nr:exodeoxyribonuclease VII large subunit [Halocatena salina]UPM45274.1 exodeoxyribonuclease VII large subunit [Halocatena salina]
MGVESPTETQATEELTSLQDTLESDQIAFVDTVATEIETVLEAASELHRYEYVIGEVTNYGISSNDHVHFDLVHEGCQLHCVILHFRREDIPTELEDGVQVAVTGELSFYTVDNYCSIMVEDAVTVGEGTYQQTYEANKQLLADDGLLEDATKQPLPDYPSCVGLVTSATSDARDDAVTSIHRRHPGVAIIVQDTTVQGESAGPSMMQAIGTLDTDARVDVIVLTRGGGSDTHLRVFNDTALCRVVHNTQTPIAVGVGHEADRTLAEDVADQRVMTPTEVGQIVPRYVTLTEQLTQQHEQLTTAYTQLANDRVIALQQRLTQSYEQHVMSELDALTTTLTNTYETLASRKRYEHEQLDRRHDHLATAYRQAVTNKLTGQHQRLEQAYERHLTRVLTDRATTLNHAYSSLKRQRHRDREQLMQQHNRLDVAYTQTVSNRVNNASQRLDHAYEVLEQQKRHEREQAQTTHAHDRQQIALAALLLLVILLVGYIILT